MGVLHPLRPLPIGGSLAQVPSGARGAIESTPRAIGIILSAMRDSRWLGTPDDGTLCGVAHVLAKHVW
jgi:hypothetical protein